MSKLLRANFARLIKDRVFLAGMAAMIVFAVGNCMVNYINMIKYEESVRFDDVFFASYSVIGILLAAFISIFIGTEYGDGTMRNKVIVGCRRTDIYLANFLCCAAAGLLMNLAYTVIACAVGIPLFGLFHSGIAAVLIFTLDGILMTVMTVSLFTLMSMHNRNKALSSVINLLFIFVLLALAIYLMARLDAPEFIEGITITEGGIQSAVPEPNPKYLTQAQREVYQFFADLLPTGQSIQIAGLSAPHPWRMALCAVVIAAAASIGGALGFRRKDLK